MGPNGWLRLEVRYLAALKAIAETGSFGRAAEKLGYTQSAISHQMAALERLVGHPLIARPGGRRPVGLTPAGSLVLGHAEAILARIQLARAGIDGLAQGTTGTLRLGTFQSVGVRVLPRAVAQLAETHPALQLEIHEEADPVDLVELVHNGDLELSFCILPVASGPFETEELLEDPWLLLVPAGSSLASDPVPLETLASMPLIGYRGCHSEERVESYLRGVGIDLHRVAYADDNAIIQGLVAEGRGVALLTDLSIDHGDVRTAAIKLADSVPPRRVALAWHRDQDLIPAVHSFVAAAREVTSPWREGVRPAA